MLITVYHLLLNSITANNPWFRLQGWLAAGSNLFARMEAFHNAIFRLLLRPKKISEDGEERRRDIHLILW